MSKNYLEQENKSNDDNIDNLKNYIYLHIETIKGLLIDKDKYEKEIKFLEQEVQKFSISSESYRIKSNKVSEENFAINNKYKKSIEMNEYFLKNILESNNEKEFEKFLQYSGFYWGLLDNIDNTKDKILEFKKLYPSLKELF